MSPAGRFDMPEVGPPATVRFPAIARTTLDNGAHVWTLRQTTVPVVTIVLVIPVGSACDPPSSPGLAGVMADLVDEGTERLDAIGLAEAFARLGTELSVDVGPDAMTMTLTALSRYLEPALGLIGEMLTRPRLRDEDLARVREVRLNGLRQLRSSASAVAERAFLRGVFADHPYGHGTLGTSAAIARMSIADVEAFHAAGVRPAGATLIVAGDVEPAEVEAAAARQLGGWLPRGAATLPVVSSAVAPGPPTVLVVDRPGAPQTEVVVGHLGPPRRTDEYPTLVTLNAVLGGQFASRINRNLRETRGLTYGAHTSFECRVASGTFSCETNVQGDATPLVVSEILREFAAVSGSQPAGGEELARAKSALTRGYVRQFETATQLAQAAARLATYELAAETFDRFVSDVEAVTGEGVTAAARQWVRPDDAVVVVVGDAAPWRAAMDALGRGVEDADIEF